MTDFILLTTVVLTAIVLVAAALLIWQVGVSPAWIILAAIAGGLYYGLKIKPQFVRIVVVLMNRHILFYFSVVYP